MEKIKKFFRSLVRRVVDAATGSGRMQQENTAQGEKKTDPVMADALRRAAGEGIVLLKNEDNTLPLSMEPVAVFGRCQYDSFYVGYGSGGDVHPPYKVSFLEGIENAGIPYDRDLAQCYRTWCDNNPVDHGWWGHWPYCYPEMELTEQLVQKAAAKAGTAIAVIGRAAGEDRENILKPGGYYLTQEEEAMLHLVCRAFPRVVAVINSGSLIDLSFLDKYNVSSLLYVWQLGQESGNALADVLTGRVCPSGRLTDTVACSYEAYPSSKNFGSRDYSRYAEDIFVGYRYFDTFCPEKVRYPFGFGLSYTRFAITPVSCTPEAAGIQVKLKVENTGALAGKEVVQLYCMPPEGELSKAKKVLVGYEKTALLAPGESRELSIFAHYRDCASFDEKGVTGFENAFVLEQGLYTLLAGNSSRQLQPVGTFTEDSNRCLVRCRSLARHSRRQRILEQLPDAIPFTGDRGIVLADVAQGKYSLDDFLAQLTPRELADLSRGEGAMDSALGYSGNAGAFGGITEQLRRKGIPPIITADGPSGLRLQTYTSLLPCGTALACTWNRGLLEEVYTLAGREAAAYGVDVLLSPGMNIHRDPLCGRNFEYYSEDPYLCGKTAAAAVRGLQAGGVSACPKHFACNNQETNRNRHDSRVSVRAMREIYLRCFEICVEEGKPRNLMTGYNKLNGIYCHYNYDLTTTVLRQEWGYEGNVVTDWWMRRGKMPEFPRIRNNAYRVRAQVDVLMPGNLGVFPKRFCRDRAMLWSLGKPGGLTLGELQRSGKNVLQTGIHKLKNREKIFQNN